jgi:hypothetical protein
MSSLSFPVIEHRRRRRLAIPWTAIWLLLVAAIAFLPWSVSNDLNPATVPTAAILLLVWSWVLGWRAIHQRLPNLRLAWFGPTVLQVLLIAMTGFFSLLLVIMRDRPVLRSTSPDGRLHAILLAAPGGTEHYVAQETHGGYMVERVARINYGLGKPVPQRFQLLWEPEKQRLVVYGDDQLLEAVAYDADGLIPSSTMAELGGGSGAAGSGGNGGE